MLISFDYGAIHPRDESITWQDNPPDTSRFIVRVTVGPALRGRLLAQEDGAGNILWLTAKLAEELGERAADDVIEEMCCWKERDGRRWICHEHELVYEAWYNIYTKRYPPAVRWERERSAFAGWDVPRRD